MKPRVVFLSERFLHPLDTGGKIRTAKLLEQLRDRWQITLVGHFDPATDGPGRSYVESLAERFVAVPRPAAQASTFGRRLSRALSPLPLAVIYHQGAALKAAVDRELGRGAELFVCDHVHSSANVSWPLGCASMVFTHNVETRILRRRVALERGPWRAFWALEHAKFRRFEARECRRFDRVIAVSESDGEEFERSFGLAGRVAVIPTGVDVDDVGPVAEPDPDLMVFCGSMDYQPNEDGIGWFLAEVLPLVRRTRPGAKLLVVGRHPSEAFVRRHAGPGVEFTGWVEDVRPHLARAALMIVPLRVGGGTRIKIYEAMARKLAVVSTTVGAEGLPLAPDSHYARADRPDDFAAAVSRLLADRGAAAAMAQRARDYVAARFGWPQVADVFAAIGDQAMAAFANRRR